MDKDRIKGSGQQTKGKVKEVAGKLTGDGKLESEGKADKAAGKVRNVVCGIKDTLRRQVTSGTIWKPCGGPANSSGLAQVVKLFTAGKG
jgi:uncharacterized protein YjbJ (UPF0337 family)